MTVTVLLTVSPVIAQTPSAEAVLMIGGSVPQPQRLKSADLAKLPRASVKAKDHNGKESMFEGIALIELLKLAGLQFDEALLGKKLEDFLVVEAANDYRAVFALPELDPAFNDRVIILADRRDSAKLSDKEGPWQVIVPGEKRQARWVRQVVALTIRTTP